MPVVLENIDCPYCSSHRSQFWAEENGYTACRCRECGLVYVNPRPSLQAIDEAARTGLHETERGQLDVVGYLSFRKRKVNMFKKRLLELYPDGQLQKRSLRWLDVGCGFGELVAAVDALTDEHSVATGIDPCRPKIDVARQRGLNARARILSQLSGDQFDVISSVNVFSHVPSPEEFVRAIKSHLLPDGEILLVTGNGGDLTPDEYPDPLYLPDHLIFAGEKHVRGMLEREGFEVLKVKRYKYFFRESLPLVAAKTVVKKMLGKPVSPWRNIGPFRSLFVRAQLRQ